MCVDINECAISRDVCSGQHCVNTVGSFTCHRDPAISDGVEDILDNDDDDDDDDGLIPVTPRPPVTTTQTAEDTGAVRSRLNCATGFQYNRHSAQCEGAFHSCCSHYRCLLETTGVGRMRSSSVLGATNHVLGVLQVCQ